MKSAFNWVGSTYKKWLVESKKSRVLKLYEKKDYVEMVRLFTSQKDYAAVTFDEFPFLYYMISEGNKEGVSCFLQKASFKDNLLFDDNNPLKCNALAYAYLQNKREVAQVLESFGFNLGVANSQGQNILHLAAIYKRKQAFLQGLSQKVNINQVDQYGNTPLHYGCRAGEPEIVESLVAGKALKLQNSIHLYPIHMAIESNSPRIVQLLRDDLWGNYPLFHPMHSAARVGACEIMRQLLKRDPILANVRDYRKMTPLHHAVATESEESVEFLLRQNDILVNCTDEFGNTPLHIAFVREHLESVKKLVESKADLQIENEDHLAPVDLGLDSLSPQMKSYLRSIEHKSSRLRDFGTRI